MKNDIFENHYDPDMIVSPTCYALGGVSTKDMIPAENSIEIQNPTCQDCWANSWDSALVGRGKACSDRRRLILVSADELENQAEDWNVVRLDVPSDSLKSFDGFAKGLASVHHRPTYGAIVNISFDENVDYPKLIFSLEEIIEDKATLINLYNLNSSQAIQETLHAGYDPSLTPHDEAKKPNKKPNKKLNKKPGRKPGRQVGSKSDSTTKTNAHRGKVRSAIMRPNTKSSKPDKSNRKFSRNTEAEPKKRGRPKKTTT